MSLGAWFTLFWALACHRHLLLPRARAVAATMVAVALLMTLAASLLRDVIVTWAGVGSRPGGRPAGEVDSGMVAPCLLLVLVGLAISLPATAVMRTLGRRLGALDSPGVAGQVKAAPRKVPNTGGVAIFLGIVGPLVAALVAALTTDQWLSSLVPAIREHLPGLRSQAPAGLLLATVLAILHVMGLVDDRRPLGPYVKLVVMLGLGALAASATDTRLLTLLDSRVGGPWLSILITVLWLVVVTNAFNFLDNMDGLSAGVAAIAASFFLTATLINGQWFIAACLALLIGSLLGFLCFNFPWRTGRDGGGATIFMGDGGSLVVGFLLAFLTVRTTYIAPSPAEPDATTRLTATAGWYGVFMPLIVLAIPLYDFCSVTLIRLSQGKSPFVGDLQHFSHRLVRHGLSKRAAVLVIYGCTAVTAIGGVSLASLRPWQAALVGLQTILVLLVLGLYEWARVPAAAAPPPSSPPS
jgi:UDP-GlcNAc:undecaprenyl-phosphate GlcNAc-1-phosphate transferase